MRDILLTLIVFGFLPLILRHAHIGVYVWSWLSYMNPQRLCWGFALSIPYAQIVAITLFASLVIGSEKKSFPIDKTVVVWLIYVAWMIFTTFFALQPDAAWEGFNTVMKIQLATFITMILITDQRRLEILIWVIVVSIGYYSFKGGIFTLTTGGQFRVYGPEKSYIQENNALGLASLMIIPLAYYLLRFTQKPYVKAFLAFFILMTAVSVLGSQSRGALVAILSVGGFFWLKSKSKIVSGAVIAVFAVIGLAVMADSWFERMDTIRNYEQDASAMSRINSWTYNFNLASDRLTGGGYRSESRETFLMYAPNPEDVHSAHSIFFGVLGDHGWPGLMLFMAVLLLSWRSLSFVIRKTANGVAELDQKRNLMARMLQVSLIAYVSGGAFLSLAYFDLPWHLIAMSVLLRNQLAETGSDASSPPTPIAPTRPQFGFTTGKGKLAERVRRV